VSIITAKNVSLSVPDLVGPQSSRVTNTKRFILNSYFGSTSRHTKTILHDINFTIEAGQRIAILGANGAGKTSLLRLLAGNLEPSSGNLQVDGHTHSLFNLQMGMHPKGTGRENIFLRGLQLGMSMKDIREKLDSVIEFADIGENIDRSFSTYSAGMRLRLAIAITLMPTPEILIMDEWIGAGDKTFTTRLSNRLNEYVDNSRALAIASHNMNLVKRICTHAILLHKGKQIAFGARDEVIEMKTNFDSKLRKDQHD